MTKEKVNFTSREQKKPVIMTEYLKKTEHLDEQQKKLEALKELVEEEKSPGKRKELEIQINEIDEDIEKVIKETIELMDKENEEAEKDRFQGTEEERRKAIKIY